MGEPHSGKVVIRKNHIRGTRDAMSGMLRETFIKLLAFSL